MKPSEQTIEQLAQMTRYVDYFQALTNLAQALTANLAMDAVLEEVMRAVSTLFRSRNWSLMLLDPKKQDLYFAIAVGGAAAAIRDMRLGLGEGIAGWVAQQRQGVLVADAATDGRFTQRMDHASKFRTASIVCAPLVCRQELLGVIELIRDETDEAPFTHESLQVLQPFADFAAIAIDNARRFQRIEEITIVDECTGLNNARYFNSHLPNEISRARRYTHDLSIIFFDLDGFKKVNDTLGHAVGTDLLRQIGNVLREAVRETDRAIRYGGDEFVVFLPATNKQGALQVAERLRVTLGQKCFAPYIKQGLQVGASFGVAGFPGDGNSAEALLEAADKAMYAAKARGRNTVVDAADVLRIVRA